MNYQQFVNAVEKNLNQKMEGGVKASCCRAVKNNGTERTGVVIEEPGLNISPTIYLEEYYDQYRKGRTMEETVDSLLQFYRSIRKEEPWDCSRLLDFEGIKDRIVFKLINTEKNRVFLRDTPHRPFLDLSIVFYVLLEVNREGTAAMPVKDVHVKRWGVKEEMLWEAGVANGMRLLPAEFITMRYALRECMFQREMTGGGQNLLSDPAQDRDQMYVLSNQLRNYGAASIVYPHILEMIGSILRDDFYVLPSSVHEVVIVPASAGIRCSDMDAMVQEINETQVAAEEVLSDTAYFYDRRTDTLQFGTARGKEGE